MRGRPPWPLRSLWLTSRWIKSRQRSSTWTSARTERLGEPAATRPSLLLEAVEDVEDSTEETDFLGRVPPCRSRICDERQRSLASFHDVRCPAGFIDRVLDRRGLVEPRRAMALVCTLATNRLVRSRMLGGVGGVPGNRAPIPIDMVIAF
jgi:hypothetical protein